MEGGWVIKHPREDSVIRGKVNCDTVGGSYPGATVQLGEQTGNSLGARSWVAKPPVHAWKMLTRQIQCIKENNCLHVASTLFSWQSTFLMLFHVWFLSSTLESRQLRFYWRGNESTEVRWITWGHIGREGQSLARTSDPICRTLSAHHLSMSRSHATHGPRDHVLGSFPSSDKPNCLHGEQRHWTPTEEQISGWTQT